MEKIKLLIEISRENLDAVISYISDLEKLKESKSIESFTVNPDPTPPPPPPPTQS